MTPALTLLALLIEAMFGYPSSVSRAVRHPAAWMGRLIGMLDRDWNRESLSHTQRRLTGVAALVMLILIVGIASYVIERSLLLLPLGMVAVALAASTLIAQRSLYEHVARVASALESGDLETAREAVSHIVGRDTADLDEAGVARAAIESLAENFSDGVVAPVFWMLLGGLPGVAIYKAINTADSMIGHRTARHQDFGWASARLDDLVNLPASRLSVLLIAAAARIDSADAAGEAIGTALRDAGKHASPNAGYPEAAMAGALGLALGGPRSYGGVPAGSDAWIGERRNGTTAADVHAALRLYVRSDAILIGAVAALAALIWIM
ncbi:adenosylcobinamide-phosphate synthase CbiB [Methyloceanibacter sp.]|jgi:adenosylcobinamide-phosphate synthase|uniref:adenosylcobinamide-phosphate synthase CbiB n=1 Tax=Methyloceanibacter sp. TaxID=1965321 RepID=UPI00351B3548